MLIEKKKTAELLPAEYNPRKDLKPGDEEYEKLKRSIEEFGYVEPVIWNKTTGRVVGGHQRLKVLIDLGITEVDCVVVEMDEAKEKALNIALNKISGDWDKDKLALLIADLQGEDFDVSLTGFDPAEIDDLFKGSLKDGIHDDNFDVDEELKKPTFTKAGDIWTLGRHRLVCGDSTKKETYDALMGDVKANLVITDPPYNVNYTTSPALTAESPSLPTATQKENTALTPAISQTATKAVTGMSEDKFRSEMSYLAALSIAKNLREKGLLSEEEYAVIDTNLRAEFSPSLGTLLSENDLI